MNLKLITYSRKPPILIKLVSSECFELDWDGTKYYASIHPSDDYEMSDIIYELKTLKSLL